MHCLIDELNALVVVAALNQRRRQVSIDSLDQGSRRRRVQS